MIKINIIILFLISLSSCSHTYYVIPHHNVPLFREKNELKAGVSIGCGFEKITSTSVQAAYSLSDQFAISSSFMYSKGGEEKKNNWGKGNYIDFAAGYYTALNSDYVFELFGGLGYCKQHHQYGEEGTSKIYNNGTADLTYSKIFIQPSIAYDKLDAVIAFTPRFSLLSFESVNDQIRGLSSEDNAIQDLSKIKNLFLFEPAFTVRGGFKHIKFQGQISYMYLDGENNLPFDPLKLTIGISFSLFERNNTNTK